MENIDNVIDEWHMGFDLESLHDYLGMTLEEYAKWLEGKMSAEELAALGYYKDISTTFCESQVPKGPIVWRPRLRKKNPKE